MNISITGNELNYIVQEGDCLWSISRGLIGDNPQAIAVLVEKIAWINELCDPNYIVPEQNLIIPLEDKKLVFYPSAYWTSVYDMSNPPESRYQIRDNVIQVGVGFWSAITNCIGIIKFDLPPIDINLIDKVSLIVKPKNDSSGFIHKIILKKATSTGEIFTSSAMDSEVCRQQAGSIISSSAEKYAIDGYGWTFDNNSNDISNLFSEYGGAVIISGGDFIQLTPDTENTIVLSVELK